MTRSFGLHLLHGALAVCAFFLSVGDRQSLAVPIFSYQFASAPPTSWDGTGASGAAVTDLSSAHHDAATTGAPTLSTNVPAGAPANAESLATDGGGMRTNQSALLNNSLIAASGGFKMDAWFNWDGTDNPQHVGKIIDYAGTDYLQIQGMNATPIVRFGFNDDSTIGTHLTAPIVANTWYHVTGVFDTSGHTLGSGSTLTGVATLYLNGVPVGSDTVTKLGVTSVPPGVSGDSFPNRIGVGNFYLVTSASLQFRGYLYNPSVDLIPEPTTLILLGLCFTMSAPMSRVRRG